MATQPFVELASRLVRDSYGDAGARVVQKLLICGGLTAPELAAKLEAPPSAVLRTLAILVHCRFVLWWNQGRKTTYFANNFEIYAILWTGSFLESWPESENVLRPLLLERGMKIGDFVERHDHREELIRLVEKGVISIARPHDFWPHTELLEQITRDQHKVLANDPMKMALSEMAKRQQIQQGTDAEVANLQKHADASENTYISTNWNKYLIRALTEDLVSSAARKVGNVSAKVYAVLMSSLEPALYSQKVFGKASSDACVTTASLIGKLNIDELSEAFIGVKELKEPTPKRLKPENESFAISINLSAAEAVNHHLRLLEEAGIKFCHRVGDRGSGEWSVNFEDVCQGLKKDTLDMIIQQSFGGPAARLVRLIRSTGRMDEKMLTNKTLLPSTEIRHHMSTLHFYGLVDCQEVPRPSERNAQKRSHYLWHHRPQWAYIRTTELLYKQLSDLCDDLSNLRGNFSTLLTKLEREDVRSNPEAFLTDKEKQELLEFRRREQELIATQMRIDRCVRIFRDY